MKRFSGTIQKTRFICYISVCETRRINDTYLLHLINYQPHSRDMIKIFRSTYGISIRINGVRAFDLIANSVLRPLKLKSNV